ncbi:hypothetical protein CYMTET_5929, partial [Cymbomonas tetramitiformis]
GRKKFVMFPPAETKRVCSPEHGFVDPRHPDLSAFPEYHQAKRMEFVLQRGDLLFLPCGWPHMVTSLTPTISLTHNYLDEAHFKTVRMAFLMSVFHKVVNSSQSNEEASDSDEETPDVSDDKIQASLAAVE